MCSDGKKYVAVAQHMGAYGSLTVFSKHIIILSRGLLTQLVFHRLYHEYIVLLQDFGKHKDCSEIEIFPPDV